MRRLLPVILVIVALLAVTSLLLAQSEGFKAPWHTIAGGGGTSSDGARFSLSGTIGQTEAGTSTDGNGFTLRGGFWNEDPAGLSGEKLYLPVVIGSG
jgi:hypothetical protein